MQNEEHNIICWIGLSLIKSKGFLITSFFAAITFTEVEMVYKTISFIMAIAVGGTGLYINIKKIKNEKHIDNSSSIYFVKYPIAITKPIQ